MSTTIAANRREYFEQHGLWPREAAGLERLARARQTGRLVGIYDADAAGIDEYGHATVCEEHGTLIIHDTYTLARSHAATPAEWCETCRAELDRQARLEAAAAERRREAGHTGVRAAMFY